MDGLHHGRQPDSWDKLPAEYQEILKEQAKVAAKYSFDTIAEDNKAATETLEAAGVEFDENPDIQSFIDKLGGNDYYLRYKDEPWYNQEILDEILAKIKRLFKAGAAFPPGLQPSKR